MKFISDKSLRDFGIAWELRKGQAEGGRTGRATGRRISGTSLEVASVLPKVETRAAEFDFVQRQFPRRGMRRPDVSRCPFV